MPELKGPQEPLPECEALIEEAYRRAGMAVRFIYIPMLRDFAETSAQVLDASAGRTDVAAQGNDNIVLSATPLLKTSLVAYTVRSRPGIKTWRDLRQGKVGYLRGDMTTRNLARENKLRTTAFASLEQGFGALRAGHLAAFVTHTTFLELAESPHLTREFNASPPLYTGYFYHALNKENGGMAVRLSRIFDEMLKDGTSEKLLGRYAFLLPESEWGAEKAQDATPGDTAHKDLAPMASHR
ncbi:substrate-binding periplasmic protein [Pseudodesulfovibrio cashew]|nr:transporter substrate-binding domain-containing protein [Pseudodesulfovibrio cashew]